MKGMKLIQKMASILKDLPINQSTPKQRNNSKETLCQKLNLSLHRTNKCKKGLITLKNSSFKRKWKKNKLPNRY